MTDSLNYYTILGLPQTASAEVIEAAFNRLTGSQGVRAEQTVDLRQQKLRQAYEVLSDPERRKSYDALLTEMGPQPFALNAQISRAQIPLAATPQLVYLLLEVQLQQAEGKRRRPLNVCLALDRSTSMQGVRLAELKTAVGHLIGHLAPDDIISIVTFSDRGELVQPPTHVSNKSAIISQVRQIRASGGTEIYQGLLTAVQTLRQTPLNQYNNHIILLTDGHTYGDAPECIELTGRAASQQIGLSAFGLGSEWNDEFLDQLVAPSGGQSAFIEEPEQIITHLQRRLQGLGSIHARNVRLVNPSTDNLQLQYAFKLLPFAQPVDTKAEEIGLGNIEGKGALSVLLEFVVPPQRYASRMAIPLTLMADIPGRQGESFTLKKQIQLIVTDKPEEAELPPDLVKAVRLLSMYRINEKVWEEVTAGKVGLAATRLRHLTTRLLEAGEVRLAQQAYAETERLTAAGTLSPEGRKKLKYGTRAMMSSLSGIEGHDPV
jgi:Ca-activated chloride channel homolog